MSKKAIVLHSGGLDSTVCLLQALERGCDTISLGIDYGQRHRIELDYAANQCKRLNIPRTILNVRWDKPDRLIPKDRSVEEIRSKISCAFLPARNIVFLALACAEAGGVNADEVWIGINAVDFSGYPDCKPEFIEAFRETLKHGFPKGPKIITPLISLTKPEIALEAARLGLAPGDTWSCYQPEFLAQGITPCGHCDACVLHAYAWANAKQI